MKPSLGRLIIILLPVFSALGSGCSLFSPGRTLELGQDSVVKIGRQKPVTLKKGAIVNVKGDPLLVESPGYVSVLMIPAAAPPQKIQLTLRAIETWGGAGFEKQSTTVVNSIVNLIIEAQTLIVTRQEKIALTKLEIAEKDYPNVSAFKYLRANCYLLMGDQRQARTILQDALRTDPDNKTAAELYRTLGGTLDRAVGAAGRSVSSQPKTRKPTGGDN
ncbi:hypothetical protein WDW37_18820 [Bdellovibrionota bacterium FG-1]